MKIVDLFCGAGIGASGIKELGYDIVFALDNDKHAVDTYNRNIGEHAICEDIKKFNLKSIPKHDILIATPVCKPFSEAGNLKGVNDSLYGDLGFYVVETLKLHKPKAFLFENVSGMTSKRNESFFNMLKTSFENVGYKLNVEVLNCSEYGVPQDRKRLFIIGIRNDIKNTFKFPKKVQYKTTIREALFDLKGLEKNNQQTLELGYSPRYKSRNRQRQWDEQAFTIISEVRHLALYPEPANYDIRYKDVEKDTPPRRFTVRECLRLQTVPDWFYFDDSVPLKKQYERCSGIPSLMAKKLIKNIVKVIE